MYKQKNKRKNVACQINVENKKLFVYDRKTIALMWSLPVRYRYETIKNKSNFAQNVYSLTPDFKI